MTHFKFNHEEKQRFACALLAAKPFAHGGYTLYADVPVKSLSYGADLYPGQKNLGNLSNCEGVLMLDFVICRDDEVILTVLTEGSMEKERLLESGLQAMPCLLRRPFLPTRFQGKEDWEAFTEEVLSRLEGASQHGDYRLCSLALRRSREQLIRRRILSENGCHSVKE